MTKRNAHKPRANSAKAKRGLKGGRKQQPDPTPSFRSSAGGKVVVRQLVDLTPEPTTYSLGPLLREAILYGEARTNVNRRTHGHQVDE